MKIRNPGIRLDNGLQHDSRELSKGIQAPGLKRELIRKNAPEQTSIRHPSMER